MTGPGRALPDAVTGLCAELAVVGRKAVAAGLVIGSGGNLSARLPGAEECVVTASGTWLDELRPEDFSLVGLADGGVLAGHPAPSSELPLHLTTYAVRPDVNAVVHLHPQASVLLTALGHRIRLLTIDHAYYVREVRTTPFVQSGTQELADAAAAAVADGANCVVLGFHGCSALGDTVQTAHKRAANLEEAARATLAMLQLGDTTTQCPAEYLEAVRAREAAVRPAGRAGG